MSCRSSGVAGLDLILRGGYPQGETTVLRGASGTGKSLFALAFAAAGGKDDPCVFATCDEDPANLRRYLQRKDSDESICFIDLRSDPETLESGGEIELGGVLARIDHAIRRTGARRLVLDAVDVLLGSFSDSPRVRRDFLSLIQWCRKHEITLLATVGEEADYRQGTGMVDYIAHCAINLAQRLDGGLMTRTLLVRKRRGSGHGTNEYPFLIDEKGIYVEPVTELRLADPSSRERLSTGLPQLDRMLGGEGIWRGSTLMISGTSGSGKTLLAATVAGEASRRGERVLYVSFEEAPANLVRDVRSIGLDLAPLVESGRLTLLSQRSIERGIEEHLLHLARAIAETGAGVVVLDPISALTDITDRRSFKNAVLRLLTQLKSKGQTVILTELLPDNQGGQSTLNMSSAVDAWIRLRQLEHEGEQVRTLRLNKARGSATSNQIREFVIGGAGLVLEEPYLGTGQLIFGSARKQQEVEDERKARILRSRRDRLERLLALARPSGGRAFDRAQFDIESRIVEIESEIAEIDADIAASDQARAMARLRRSA